jgi:hypothetical protein
MANGMKNRREARKIPDYLIIMVNPTDPRAPGDDDRPRAVRSETRTKITVPGIQKLLNSAPGVIVIQLM